MKLDPESLNAKLDGRAIRKRRNVNITDILLVVLLLFGFSVMIYPAFSNWWNIRHASRMIAGYQEAIEDLSEEERLAALDAARAYNASLPDGVGFELSEEQLETYQELLDVGGTGIMGYVEVPKIHVRLPIYHGVDDTVLQVAVGHIPGSSLPVGGARTHTVLSGHRGLPSAELFSDLDQLVKGDYFRLNVMGETLTYRVDQIKTVLPDNTEDLGIVPGKDYCTLVTCTPYGVNTHRMLIRGIRTLNIEDESLPMGDLTLFNNRVILIVIGICGVVIFILGLILRKRKHKRNSP